jgi:predicted nucleotidyltransferase
MAVEDIEKANRLLVEFVNELTAEFPKEIDYILIAGSVPRGDFRIGESDIDLTVMVKKGHDHDAINRCSHEIFWRLDEKHGTGLLQFYKREYPDSLYRPKALCIHGSGSAKVHSLFRIFSPLLGFKRSLLRHAKISGKILYGRDILREISLCEKNPFQILFTYNIFMSLAAFLVFPLYPDRSLHRTIRALIYAFEDALYDPASDNHEFAKNTLEAKINFKRIKDEWSYFRKVSYCAKAPLLIARNNFQNLIQYASRQSGKSTTVK